MLAPGVLGRERGVVFAATIAELSTKISRVASAARSGHSVQDHSDHWRRGRWLFKW